MTPATGTGPRSNDPLRCGLNSSPSNITAMCNLPQFAKIPQGMYGDALLLLCSANSRSILEFRCHLPSCGGATVGWVGAPKFLSRLLLPSGRLHVQPEVLKASLGSPHELRLTDSPSVGSGPVSTLPELAEGAACQCWLGTWPHDPCHGDRASFQ